jgi:cell division protein FtsB
MGSAKLKNTKLKKTDANEKFAGLLRQYGSTLLGLLLLALLVHDIFGAHGYLAMRRTQQEINKVKTGIEQLNKENLQLEDEVKELKSDPHKIEKIARDELGLARPGEVIIKIPQSQQLPQASSVKP